MIDKGSPQFYTAPEMETFCLTVGKKKRSSYVPKYRSQDQDGFWLSQHGNTGRLAACQTVQTPTDWLLPHRDKCDIFCLNYHNSLCTDFCEVKLWAYEWDVLETIRKFGDKKVQNWVGTNEILKTCQSVVSNNRQSDGQLGGSPRHPSGFLATRIF